MPLIAALMRDDSQSHSIRAVRKALDTLIESERKNQFYYLAAGAVGLGLGVGLVVWSLSGRIPSNADYLKGLMNGVLPFIGSALSVTRIVNCESRIAQYKAASLMSSTALPMAFELLSKTLKQGVGRGG